MIVSLGLRDIRDGVGECSFAARMFGRLFPLFLSKAIRGSPASMGLADSSRRIRIADIELAYRITGHGKP